MLSFWTHLACSSSFQDREGCLFFFLVPFFFLWSFIVEGLLLLAAVGEVLETP
jgi:hypothetical protein